MLVRILFFFGCLIPALSVASTDSIYAALSRHTQPDTTRVKLLYSYADELSETDFDAARNYYKNAIALSGNLKNNRYSGDASLAFAQAYDDQAIHDSAILYYTAAFTYYKNAGLTDRQADVLNMRGIAYENMVNYAKAFNDYFESLQLYKSVNNEKGMANACINIGLIYQYQGNYPMSDKYFNDALQICKRIHNMKGEMAVYNNLAINFKNKGDRQRALYYYRLAYTYHKSQLSYLSMSNALNNIGVVYEEMGLYDSALYCFQESAKYKLLHNDYVGLGNALNNIASSLIGLKRYKDAMLYLDSSEHINKRYGYDNNQVQNYYNRFRIMKSMGVFDKALDYFIQYRAAEDSIIKAENERILSTTQQQYELEIINNKIAMQEATLERTERLRKINISIIVVLLFIAGTLLYFYIQRNRLNKQLKEQSRAIDKQNQQLRHINRELHQAKDVAENAVKAKGQFLSLMSHEIRTPLNAIIAIANLLETSDDTAANAQNLKVLKSASENLVNLVNDILDLSKMESGKLYLSVAPFNFKKLINQAAALYDVNAKSKGLAIHVSYDSSLPERLQGDELRLNQVLSNLISNAIKFTEQGEVSIHVKMVSETENAFHVHIEVADTGIGIPLDKQELIFKSFEQADSTTSRKYGGTGLGLSICKRILALYNAELLLDSEPGKGSRFYFTLTMPKADDGNIIEQDAVVQKPIDYSGKNVLIVDDNPVNIYVIEQFLKRIHIKTSVAENGKQALRKMEMQMPDLILMDIHMPEMGGYETAQAIRKLMYQVPIVAVTASTSVTGTEFEKMKSAGMNDYMLKPFQVDELHRLLNKYLG
jgi:signal transduction histidine kinase